MSTLKWMHEARNKLPMHYWISSKHGYLLSSSNYCPAKGTRKKNGKISYIGFTFDEGWPKRMNTGRLYYAEVKKKKPSVGYKTDSGSIGKTTTPASASNGAVTR
jgi:hypothetical protein